MSHKKVYVEVTASFRPDGVILPREIVWEDGGRGQVQIYTFR